MIKRVRRVVVVIAVLSVMVLSCYSDENRAVQEMSKIQKTTIRNERFVVKAQCVTTTNGSTVGFRVEIINPSLEKNVLLYLRDNISMLDVSVKNEKGVYVSLYPEAAVMYHRRSDMPKDYKYDAILPCTSHAWFINFPKQIRADYLKGTNIDNIKTTPAGKYIAELTVTVFYLSQDKTLTEISERPAYNSLQVCLPGINVVIDQDSLSRDILETYLAGDRDN